MTALATLAQASRMLVRDWRSGELRLLAAALVVAVASVASVSFFADRLGRALVRDAHQLLGADLVLVADRPWPRAMSEELTRRNLQQAVAFNFISMTQLVAAGRDASHLAGVKAVTANYPLRGRLRTAPGPGMRDAPAATGPARGTVWLDERLTSALGARVGARVRLGMSEFEVAAVLTLEPERSANFFNLAPRLMMHVEDVAATGLIQTGSRIRYYLYAAGPADAIAAYEAWAKARLARGQRVDNLESGRPEVRATVERARRFLALTAMLAVVLAGVAIALGARRFVERHLDGCAVMRCLGATQGRLLALYGVEFLLLGLIACAAATLVGYMAQALIAHWLAAVVRAALPAPTVLPAIQAVLIGVVLLLGFALPPLLQLKGVPALRVIRREAGTLRKPAGIAYGSGFAALAGLLVWQAGDLKLGAYMVAAFTVAAAAFIGVAWLALQAVAAPRLARFVARGGIALRYGLANLRRRAGANSVQAASLALGLTALLLLTVIHHDLVHAWRRAAPADAPNRFVLGIQAEQLAPVREFFSDKGIALPDIYPMVRGRLTAVNGRPVRESDYAEDRARRLVEREFNLSYMAEPPGHNTISAGRWFAPTGRNGDEVSVEEGIARALGLQLGDEVTYAVGADSFSARITSLRRLRWDSMKVNFFVIGPPPLLEKFPASYICAFRIEATEEPIMNLLAARFPNLTIVDVGAAVRQANEVVDQLVIAVRFVFLFAVAAGVLVLYAALIATEDERRREVAVLRVVGASRRQVASAQRIEFLVMGALAGVVAAVAASIIGEVLARRIFDLDLPFNPWLWVIGPLAGLLLLAFNAWISARRALAAPPALTLRDSG